MDSPQMMRFTLSPDPRRWYPSRPTSPAGPAGKTTKLMDLDPTATTLADLISLCGKQVDYPAHGYGLPKRVRVQRVEIREESVLLVPSHTSFESLRPEHCTLVTDGPEDKGGWVPLERGAANLVRSGVIIGSTSRDVNKENKWWAHATMPDGTDLAKTLESGTAARAWVEKQLVNP